jgi:hypothetical protein
MKIFQVAVVSGEPMDFDDVMHAATNPNPMFFTAERAQNYVNDDLNACTDEMGVDREVLEWYHTDETTWQARSEQTGTWYVITQSTVQE